MRPAIVDDGTAQTTAHITPGPRLQKRLAASKWVVLAILISLLTLYATVQSHLQNQRDLGRWGCRMSWMSPNYVRLEGPTGPNVKGLDRKYAVWLYKEGGLQPDLLPRGMPVLFIPGNSGSFKQVRSIASSAAHQFFQRDEQSGSVIGFVDDSEATKNWKELDFFAVDFNEEFSAFHPNTLRDQSLFVANAIQYILSLYPEDDPASQRILLLGHSMGGIVARHAVTRLGRASVPAIITMSTPHLLPPVTFERGMQDIYDEMDVFWQEAYLDQTTGAADTLHSVPPVLISICGGTADTQISSDSCALRPIPRIVGSGKRVDSDAFDNGTFAVFTTGMEGVWTGVDHQAMVWCDQVRRIVATTLLDMSAIMHDHPARPVQLRGELAQTARRRFLGERTQEELQRKDTGLHRVAASDHQQLTPEHPTFRHGSTGHSSFKMNMPPNATRFQIIGNMRLNGVGRKGGSAMTIHLESASNQAPVHDTLIPLTTLRILPKSAGLADKAAQREAFPVQGEGVKDEEVLTYAEADFDSADYARRIVLQLEGAGWGSVSLSLLEGDNGISGWKPIKQSHSFEHVHGNSLFLHDLQLRRPPGCSGSASPSFSTIVEHVSHANAVTHESRMFPQAEPLVRLHSHTESAPYIKNEPLDAPTASSGGLAINLWQDPNDPCGVQSVSARVNWTRSLGLMVMRYRMAFLAWTVGIGALVIAVQFRRFRLTGVFPRFGEALEVFSGKHLAVLFLSLAGGCLLQSTLPSAIVQKPEDYFLGVPMWYSSLWVLPVLAISYAIVLASHFMLCGLEWVLGVCLRCAGLLRVMKSHEQKQDFKAQYAISALALILLVKLVIPHQFAFIVGFVVHHLTVSGSESSQHSRTTCAPLYHSLLLLLFWLLPAHGAVLFVWMRNLLILIDRPRIQSQQGTSSWMQASSGLRESLFLNGEDHQIWHVFAILVIVEACSAGKTLDISTRYRPFCYATEISLLIFAIVAFTMGGRYFHTVVETIQLFLYVQAAWFVAPGLLARFDSSGSAR